MTDLKDKHPQLTEKLEEICKELSLKISGIKIVNGSKTSAHSNAYVYVICKKEIVLFDTLIEQLPEERHIAAVIRHEIGHVIHGHLKEKIIRGDSKKYLVKISLTEDLMLLCL